MFVVAILFSERKRREIDNIADSEIKKSCFFCSFGKKNNIVHDEKVFGVVIYKTTKLKSIPCTFLQIDVETRETDSHRANERGRERESEWERKIERKSETIQINNESRGVHRLVRSSR